MGQIVRFGILGASRIAKKAMIPALMRSPAATLSMVGSRNPDTARTAFGNVRVATYDDVLASPEVDAVYIALPNALHEEWAVKALRAGKHVWCEKPAALSYQSAARMTAAARESGVRLMEGFTFLAHPQHARAREIAARGTLGELVSFSGVFSYPRPQEGDIRLDPALGGGSYFDAAVYPIRASRLFFDTEPESAFCRMIPDAAGVDAGASLALAYPGGRFAHLTSAWSDCYRSTYELLGNRGGLSAERAYAVPPNRAVKISLESGDEREEILCPAVDQFALMLDAFCGELAEGSARPGVWEADLLAQARVVEAGRRSHEERRSVELAEVG